MSRAGGRYMQLLRVCVEIGTMDRFIKLDVENRVNRSRECGTGLVNKVNPAALIDEKMLVTLKIREYTVV